MLGRRSACGGWSRWWPWQVHADLKHAALRHLLSGKFAANAAWLVLAVMAFNLTRAAATITGPGFALMIA